MSKQTRGEYRVGIDFNPGGNSSVKKIKRAAADLIDLIEHEIPMQAAATSADPAREAEVMRLKALAQTAVEDAAMWGVKAATKPAPVAGN